MASFGWATFLEGGTQYPLPDVEEVATYHRIYNGGVIRQAPTTGAQTWRLTRSARVTLDEYLALASMVGDTATLTIEHFSGPARLQSVRGNPGELGNSGVFFVELTFLLE